VLTNDYYSLAFYGFYLDSDHEDLSAVKDVKDAKKRTESGNSIVEDGKLDGNATGAGSRKLTSPGLKRTDTGNWLREQIRDYRIRRNSKNMYKVLLVFVI